MCLLHRRSLCLLTFISSSHGIRPTSSHSLSWTRKIRGEKPSSPLLISNLNAKTRSRKVSIPPCVHRSLADILSTTAQFSGSGRRMGGEGFTGTQPRRLGTHFRVYEHTAGLRVYRRHMSGRQDGCAGFAGLSRRPALIHSRCRLALLPPETGEQRLTLEFQLTHPSR